MVEAASFEELEAGDRFPLDNVAVARDEVIDFAARFDPQPYHLDDATAAASPVFKRLSASGWHTLLMINLLIHGWLTRSRLKSVAGGGVQEARWHHPVYPGDTLSGGLTIVGKRSSKSRPDLGILDMRVELLNQEDRLVATMTVTGLFERGFRNAARGGDFGR